MPNGAEGERPGRRGWSRRASRLAVTWGPPICWMALLFALSSLPGTDVGLSPYYAWVLRKCAHCAGYAILGALVYRALARTGWPLGAGTGVASVALAGIYAFTDERHQLYVPARTGTWLDVGIDLAGATFAAVLVVRYVRRIG